MGSLQAGVVALGVMRGVAAFRAAQRVPVAGPVTIRAQGTGGR